MRIKHVNRVLSEVDPKVAEILLNKRYNGKPIIPVTIVETIKKDRTSSPNSSLKSFFSKLVTSLLKYTTAASIVPLCSQIAEFKAS